jgi:hypothetical protein
METESCDHLQRILDLQAENNTYQQHVATADAERLVLVGHVVELQDQVMEGEVHVEFLQPLIALQSPALPAAAVPPEDQQAQSSLDQASAARTSPPTPPASPAASHGSVGN